MVCHVNKSIVGFPKKLFLNFISCRNQKLYCQKTFISLLSKVFTGSLQDLKKTVSRYTSHYYTKLIKICSIKQ